MGKVSKICFFGFVVAFLLMIMFLIAMFGVSFVYYDVHGTFQAVFILAFSVFCKLFSRVLKNES